MLDDGQLPLVCPHCQHTLATLTVRSRTILTVTCANCGYMWAIEMASMPDFARRAVDSIDLEEKRTH